MAAGYKNLTEKEFEQIKTLLSVGVKQPIIKQVTGRSRATISRIVEAANFKDYKATMYAFNQERTSQRKSPMEIETPTETVEETAGRQIALTLNRVADILTQLAEDIAFLKEREEARESSEKKNRMVFGHSRR